jgi:hypothetical protein
MRLLSFNVSYELKYERELSGSYGDEYEDDSPLDYDAV